MQICVISKAFKNETYASKYDLSILTKVGSFLWWEAHLWRVFWGDAMDGGQGYICICAGQPSGLCLFGPALHISWLQHICPGASTTHDVKDKSTPTQPWILGPLEYLPNGKWKNGKWCSLHEALPSSFKPLMLCHLESTTHITIIL